MALQIGCNPSIVYWRIRRGSPHVRVKAGISHAIGGALILSRTLMLKAMPSILGNCNGETVPPGETVHGSIKRGVD